MAPPPMKKTKLAKKTLSLSTATVRALDHQRFEHVAGAGFVQSIINLSTCVKPTLYCTLSVGSCGGDC